MAYKPQKASVDQVWAGQWGNDIGWLLTEYEALEPDPNYTFTGRRMPSKDAWPIVELSNGPKIGDLPQVIQNLINSTWKRAEPAKDATRSAGFAIGTRGQTTTLPSTDTYHPQVRPTRSNITVQFGSKTPIADDWKLFEQIKRVNAVTYRGDTRAPAEVISRCQGFYPPNTRTDQYYLEHGIYDGFSDYLQRRYQRTLTLDEFRQAVRSAAPSEEDKKLIVDYMMWRKICEREAVHLGRMVSNECLKGYISTARAIDTSITFGSGYNQKPGWLYLTVVHGGFVVPWGQQTIWGSEEAEIAQWGPIPADRIVGFRHIAQWAPDGPIYIRKSFRKKEPKAFEYMFKVMSGMLPA